MLNVGVIGIGNCGNQICCLAQKEANCEVFAINTSENDLATLPESVRENSYLVGDSEGSGKNRAAAKKFLKSDITKIVASESFVNFMTSKDVVLIASSTGGGTGSGMAPIMSDIVRKAFKNSDGSEKCIILVGVLPRLNEGYSTQVNTLEYTHELYDVLEDPTYMLYDNNNYSKETSYVVLQKVNQAIVDDIKVIQCQYNVSTPFDSIDERDMKTILSTPGRIAISSLLGVKEKDLDEKSIEQALIENLKKNAHAELQRDGIVQRTGVITNLSDKLNSVFDTHLNEVREFVGEPVEEFLHISVNSSRDLPNNVCLILTGLSKISDRIDKIRDRIDEINQNQAEKEASKRESSDVTSEDIEKLNEKRNYRTVNDGEDNVDLKALFGKFGS